MYGYLEQLDDPQFRLFLPALKFQYLLFQGSDLFSPLHVRHMAAHWGVWGIGWVVIFGAGCCVMVHSGRIMHAGGVWRDKPRVGS